jgi:hypothetical protein
LLSVVSLTANLRRKTTIIDLSQGVQRLSMRTDGLVPTLGTGCSRLFVPHAAVFLSARQTLALQGFDHRLLNLTGIPEEQIYHVAGNAMGVPVVGCFMIAVLAVLKPTK